MTKVYRSVSQPFRGGRAPAKKIEVCKVLEFKQVLENEF